MQKLHFSTFRCTLLSGFILLTFPYSTIAQDSGYLIFNLGKNAYNSSDTIKHTVNILGCDTLISHHKLYWSTNGQVIANIPYGSTGKNANDSMRYNSKYYIASPPVLPAGSPNQETLYNIGLVTPDEFWLEGEKPAQLIYLDYSILKKTQIEYFNFTYDKTFAGEENILVPFNVECIDFQWNETVKVPGAKGASGIGYFLGNATKADSLFLPYFIQPMGQTHRNALPVKLYLDCKITLLNDILSDHDLQFIVNGKNVGDTINLKSFGGTTPTIQLTRIPKTELPCGCKPRVRAALRDEQ